MIIVIDDYCYYVSIKYCMQLLYAFIAYDITIYTIEAAETFEMRRLLEREALVRLIDVITDEKITQLRNHLDCESYADRTNDPSSGYKLRNDFHYLIVELSEHSLLAE